ncbi:MAG: hypothetical protein AAGH92_12230 [Planctomycetota bacterium]
MREAIRLTVCVAAMAWGSAALSEGVISEAGVSGDLSSLNPPVLYGQEINPDKPWRGRLRRVWGGALDVYREWEANQVTATADADSTPIPLPSAALGGLALLGGVGGLRVMRRPSAA